MFLLAFNPLLKLVESLNHPHGYHFKIPIEGSETLPPVGSHVYVKWTEAGEESPGWYRAHVDQYLSCKIIYDDSDDCVAFEVVALLAIEWKPWSKRARKFVPLDGRPVFTKETVS